MARPGIPIEFGVAPYPDREFTGEVYFVSPTLDPETRRLLVKAWVENAEHRLRPGLFTTVRAEVGRKEDALLVPEAAVALDREGAFVWRVTPEDRAERAPVDTGLRVEGRVEITSGLRPGDRVVAAGINKVSAGDRVRSSSPPASHHAVPERGPRRDTAKAGAGAGARAGAGTGSGRLCRDFAVLGVFATRGIRDGGVAPTGFDRATRRVTACGRRDPAPNPSGKDSRRGRRSHRLRSWQRGRLGPVGGAPSRRIPPNAQASALHCAARSRTRSRRWPTTSALPLQAPTCRRRGRGSGGVGCGRTGSGWC